MANGKWSNDTSKCQRIEWAAPSGAGNGSWSEVLRRRTLDGAMKSPSVKELSRRRHLEPAMATGMRECVGARLMPEKHLARLGVVVFEQLHTPAISNFFL